MLLNENGKAFEWEVEKNQDAVAGAKNPLRLRGEYPF
jgi:hypothetical protein